MRRFCLTMVCLVGLVPGTLTAGQKVLPPDLAFVPPDCLGFAHIRLVDIWKSDQLTEWRETVLKAGKDALNAFDAQYFPPPSSLERLTIMVNISSERFRQEPEPIFILATSRAIDRAAFKKQMVPGAVEEMVAGKTLLVDKAKRIEIYFVDDRTLAVGPTNTVRKVLTAQKIVKGPLTEALHAAHGSSKPIVLAVNRDAIPIPSQMIRLLPEEIHPLTKFKVALVGIDFKQQGSVDVRMTFSGAGEATAGEAAAKEGINQGRAFLEKGRAEMQRAVIGDGKPGSLDDLPKAAASLFALGLINQADDFLATLPLKKAGNTLSLSVEIPYGSQAIVSAYAAAGAFAFFTLSGNRPARPELKDMSSKPAEKADNPKPKESKPEEPKKKAPPKEDKK